MSENSACITVSLEDGSITITGSETFIEKNKEDVFNFVERNIQTKIKHKMIKDEPIEISTDVSTKGATIIDTEDKYITNGVYHIDPEDKTISILKKVPGNTTAEKSKNIALIVLHIKKGKIMGKEIIPLCEKHNCYDASNFSSIFKNEKTNIIRKGTGQSWTIELTLPGEKAAIDLLEEMANDKK